MKTCTEAGCDRKHQARGYCGSHYNKHFPNPSPQKLTPCTVCGTMLMKDKRVKRRAVCSEMCKKFLQWGEWPTCKLPPWPKAEPTRRELALAKLATVAKLPPSRRRWYSIRCKRCGGWFVHDQPQTNFCTLRCTKRAMGSRRRARKRHAFVEDVRPVEIYERDGWRCQIPQCLFKSRAVARRRMGTTQPKAPTLDHIVPLALGGKHERSNLQCAHFMCNSLKSDRAANDQLLLFG